MSRPRDVTPAEYYLEYSQDRERYYRLYRSEKFHLQILEAYFNPRIPPVRVYESVSAGVVELVTFYANDKELSDINDYIKRRHKSIEPKYLIAIIKGFINRAHLGLVLTKIPKDVFVLLLPPFNCSGLMTPYETRTILREIDPDYIFTHTDAFTISSLPSEAIFVDAVKHISGQGLYNIVYHFLKCGFSTKENLLYIIKKRRPECFLDIICSYFKNNARDILKNLMGESLDELFESNLLNPIDIFSEPDDDTRDAVTLYLTMNNM